MEKRKVFINTDNPRKLKNYISAFLDLENELKLNSTTLRHHTSVLERFGNISSVDSIRENGVKAVEDFFSSCNTSFVMSEYSQKSYYSVLKKFFKFLRENDVIENKVIEEVEEHRFLLPDVKPFFFSESDDKKIIAAMKKKPKNRGGEVFERNVMVLKLMRFAGMRPVDVREVRINDIYSNGRGVFHVPFGEELDNASSDESTRREVTIVEEIISDELHVLLERGYNFLCESPKSKRILTTDELGLMSKKIQKNAGIDEPLGLMAYRHTYIKELCEEGLKVDTIRRKAHLSSRRAILNYFTVLGIKQSF